MEFQSNAETASLGTGLETPSAASVSAKSDADDLMVDLEQPHAAPIQSPGSPAEAIQVKHHPPSTEFHGSFRQATKSCPPKQPVKLGADPGSYSMLSPFTTNALGDYDLPVQSTGSQAAGTDDALKNPALHSSNSSPNANAADFPCASAAASLTLAPAGHDADPEHLLEPRVRIIKGVNKGHRGIVIDRDARGEVIIDLESKDKEVIVKKELVRLVE